MVSEKKAEANRANSRRATGPTSPEGKARARLNALSHGLFSKQLVVPSAGETPTGIRFPSLPYAGALSTDKPGDHAACEGIG